MAIFIYHHHWGRQILNELGCVHVQEFSLYGDQQSFQYDWHLCLWNMAHNDKHTQENITDNTTEERQCRTWSTPKKSKVPQVCAPFPSETETLKEQVSKGTGSVLLTLCSSTCATKKVTQNPLASVFFFEIQALKMCPAHNEYFVWIPSFDPLSNILIYTLLLSSFSKWEN